MIDAAFIIPAATVAGGVGIWLMLPRGNRRGWRLGVALCMVALGLIGSQLSKFGNWEEEGAFGVLAVATLISAVGAISCRSPVYCAIWFGLSLVGTAGLFLYAGAQFLGVATIIVYAGAILVTFLFVLMLAQPSGHAFFDRISWQGFLSAATGAVLVGLLTSTMMHTFGSPVANKNSEKPSTLPTVTAKFTTEQLETDGGKILTSDHMARLGGELFSRNLIAVEIAGTLLLIALVGTVAIVGQSKAAHEKAGRKSHG